jgi:glucose-1-phosphatase
MQSDKIVLFDWGNIVVDNMTKPYSIMAFKEILLNGGATDVSNISSRLAKYPGVRDSKLPTISKLEPWFLYVKEEFKLDCTYQEFIDNYYLAYSKVPFFQDVIDFEYSLKDRCQIGLLSNLLVLDYQLLAEEFDLNKFDHIFLSYELECRKPEPIIYQKVMQKLKLKPNNILFFDDKLVNIMAARKMGWQAYQVTGLELNKMKSIVEDFLK